MQAVSILCTSYSERGRFSPGTSIMLAFTFGVDVYLVMWGPVTTTWHVLGLRMEETASRYGE